jgi:hypothetical protein
MLHVWMRIYNNVITTIFCLMFSTCHLHGTKQTLPYVKISNLLTSNLSSLFSIGQLFKFPLLPNRINSQNLNTLFLLVHLCNTVPLSYWSFLSLCHPLTLSNPLSQ